MKPFSNEPRTHGPIFEAYLNCLSTQPYSVMSVFNLCCPTDAISDIDNYTLCLHLILSLSRSQVMQINELCYMTKFTT